MSNQLLRLKTQRAKALGCLLRPDNHFVPWRKVASAFEQASGIESATLSGTEQQGDEVVAKVPLLHNTQPPVTARRPLPHSSESGEALLIGRRRRRGAGVRRDTV